MAAISLEDAQTHLSNWLQADLAVSDGQKYEIGGRELTRVDADMITNKIKFWESYCNKIKSGRKGLRAQRVMPLDI